MKHFLTLIFFCCCLPAFSQVLGYPGATWLFEDYAGGNRSLWTYEGDSIVEGDTLRYIKQQNKNWLAGGDDYGYFVKHHFYREDNDTVWEKTSDGWVEVCNFSLQLGDEVPSPLYRANQLEGSALCYDEALASIPAKITVKSISTESGIPLPYYMITFATKIDGNDTTFASMGYQKRMLLYFYSLTPYLYYFIPGCPTESAMSLSCYYDDGLPPSEVCHTILDWFNEMDIPDNHSQDGMSVYPNPAVSHIQINVKETSGPWQCAIYTADGKLVLSQSWSGGTLDVASLTPGLYFVSLTQGREQFWEKMTKE